MRLRRSDLSAPGIARRRRGRGFTYTGVDGRPLTDADTRARIDALVIPPAWKDVWISPDPRGHIQAAGTDAAGRRQYLYHEAWRRRRDEQKFDHVLDVARRLPRLRRRLAADLKRRGLCRRRVLAAVVKLIDLGLFRVGGEEYAKGDTATYGVSTLRPGHVTVRQGGRVEFRYRAKGGIERFCLVSDEPVAAVIRQLRRRPDAERLFAYRDGDTWHDVHSSDVNRYLREISGTRMTAKDFRTWHATVLAAVRLAGRDPESESPTRRRRTVARVMREVSEDLGNTPAVARASYVDPRVVEAYEQGEVAEVPPTGTPTEAAERAVRELLADE